MYRIGERVVTDHGVGDILRIEHERYYVYLEFPQDNSHARETWMVDSEIRYSITEFNDKSFLDEDTSLRIRKQKVKKETIKYSYGSYKTVWR